MTPTANASLPDAGRPADARLAQNAEMTAVIVTLKDQADLSRLERLGRNERLRRVVDLLKEKAAATQGPIVSYLETQRQAGLVSRVISLWGFNGLAVTASPAVIDELRGRPDVLRLVPDEVIPAPRGAAASPAEPNLTQINAPALWALGMTGQGVVVASLDTGVDVYHPDLSAQWRGGTNSWFDPNGQHPDIPYDADGHGTQTMGVMVGGEAGGSAIGVAPGAQWIAVKIFNDQGSATASGIHLSYQWLLDPDGNSATPDAPHVVNNSWTYASPGCNLEFQLDLQALRAAGILPVFAAGNAGPDPSTSVSPSNNPEAFAVGGVNNNGDRYLFSSRGPSACGEAEHIFPELVAPGVDIRSSDLFGSYSSDSGTSLAAPHVSGSLALLLSVYPDLTAFEQEQALVNSAVDLGVPGADNDFGHGRLDVLAAFQYLQATQPTPTPEPPTPTFTPTATATATPSQTPTATPTPTIDPAINQALNRPVTVSSFQDSSHNGAKAVDGNLSTYWQAKRLSGLQAEWIKVDLGSTLSIGKVELEWVTYYARSYTIQVSVDNSTWTTVFSTASGNGGNDTVIFTATPARYVLMNSTAWNNGNYRIRLKEFEIYAGASSPTPTPPAVTATSSPTATLPPPSSPTSTSTQTAAPTLANSPTPTGTTTFTATPTATILPPASPTPTGTPTPPVATATLPPTATSTATALPTSASTFTATPTATLPPPASPTPTATQGSGATLHVGDLDGSSSPGVLSRWNAAVSITVHGPDEAPVANATVSGNWSGGVSGTGSCVTNSLGQCSLTLSNIRATQGSATFTVSNVSHAALSYSAASNHDPDGDSNGVTITIARP